MLAHALTRDMLRTKRNTCESSSTGAQSQHVSFEHRARQYIYADLPDEDSARPSKAPRVRRSNRFTSFINRQTESHFAVAAKNVKQHFHANFFASDFLLKVRAASLLRCVARGNVLR